MTGENAKPHQYRRYAEDCMRMAQEARTLEQRTLLLDMAQRWMELAEQSGRIRSRRDPPDAPSSRG